jgi:hypothetical protein
MRWFVTMMVAVLMLAACLLTQVVQADIRTKLLRETAEFVMKKGGKEVAGETVETLAKKMTTLAVRHGDDVVVAAFRRVGPRAAKLASEAGEHSAVALKLLGRYGDDGIRLASRPKALQLAAKFGDDVAEPLLRHGDVGERLIEQFGADGVAALSKLSEQNVRRLAILVKENGDKVTPGLMQVFARHGDADKVAEWLWRNKGSVFVGAGLVTFVANPDLYVNAAESVANTTLEQAVHPLAEMPKAVAVEAAAHTSSTPLVILMLLALGGGGWYLTRKAGLGSILLRLAANYVASQFGKGKSKSRDSR